MKPPGVVEEGNGHTACSASGPMDTASRLANCMGMGGATRSTNAGGNSVGKAGIGAIASTGALFRIFGSAR